MSLKGTLYENPDYKDDDEEDFTFITPRPKKVSDHNWIGKLRNRWYRWNAYSKCLVLENNDCLNRDVRNYFTKKDCKFIAKQ